MPLLSHELARWKNGQLELRPDPLRVRWTFEDLVTSDGHALRCTFSCSTRGLPDPTERRMFQEVLLGSRLAVTEQDLVTHFHRSLKAGAEKVVEGRPVAELLGEEGKRALVEALRTSAQVVAFACGVEVLPPFHVETESPTLQHQRQRAMQRTLAEQQAAGQIEHLQRAADLFKQFQEMRRAEPSLSAGQVLQQINPSDRGSVLQKLLLASASDGAPRELMAVAGPYLVRIRRSGDNFSPELVPLPPTVGPLRSIQAAEVEGSRVLLIGARSGFLLVNRADPSDATAYSDPELSSDLGFSRVVYLGPGRGFCGCHGDGGLVLWKVGETSAPSRTLRTAELGVLAPEAATASVPSFSPSQSIVHSMAGGTSPRPGGPRNVVPLADGAVLFSLGRRLMTYAWEDGLEPLPQEGDADVVAILPEGRQLHVVYEDGTLCSFDRATMEMNCRERRSGRVRAAGALPWLGEVRLLIAGDDGPIHCIGTGDSVVTHYASSHRAFRAVTGTAEMVAALSGDRQRIVLWNSWDGRKPVGELFLGATARHRVADVAFA